MKLRHFKLLIFLWLKALNFDDNFFWALLKKKIVLNFLFLFFWALICLGPRQASSSPSGLAGIALHPFLWSSQHPQQLLQILLFKITKKYNFYYFNSLHF
jgi:hypothetical protein